MKIIILNKKAISPIIATILLILLSVAAVLLIANIIVPFVRNTLDENKMCFDASDQIKIDTESDYTCYLENAEGDFVVNVTIQRGTKEIEIDGFLIGVSGEAIGKSYEVKAGESTDVEMLDGSTNLELPGKGGSRTYSITIPKTEIPDIGSILIAPIVNDKTCKESDEAGINLCI